LNAPFLLNVCLIVLLVTGFPQEDGENNLYIITTAHGVDHSPTSAKIHIDGEEYEAENLSVNSTIDMAVYKVEREGTYYYPAVASAGIATQVMALGYPQNEEMSAEIGVPLNTVLVRMHRAVAALKKHLLEREEERNA
jgi:hypothetical protein